ncbi:hypothetical protein HDU98_008794 [Podochytrium sp. JEL0797]|nr:hypothetical protein HDU98_008794 [Podochytrium sp. JEL0797]
MPAFSIAIEKLRHGHNLQFKQRIVKAVADVADLLKAQSPSRSGRGAAALVANNQGLNAAMVRKWVASSNAITDEIKLCGKSALHFGWGRRMHGGGTNTKTKRAPTPPPFTPLSESPFDLDGSTAHLEFKPEMLQCRFPAEERKLFAIVVDQRNHGLAVVYDDLQHWMYSLVREAHGDNVKFTASTSWVYGLPFTPLPPPPSASATVNVSILLNGRFTSDPRAFVLEDKTKVSQPKLLDSESVDFPVFCFLIEKQLGGGRKERIVFDLGIRKDTQNFSPATAFHLPHFLPHPTHSPDVVESLARGGLTPSDIDTVILSHNHFDHCGNPFLFPESTKMIIGGFADAESEQKLSVERREEEEGDGEGVVKRFEWRKVLSEGGIEWEAVGAFERGWDYFGDGSFWLIDAPGHCVGHIAALARTTACPPSYVLCAGDAAHAKCLYCPCPPAGSFDTRSLCGQFTDSMKTRDFLPNEPLFSIHDDLDEAYRTIARISRMDAEPNVLVVPSHEVELVGVLDLFPGSANGWMGKGWKGEARRRLETGEGEMKVEVGEITGLGICL